MVVKHAYFQGTNLFSYIISSNLLITKIKDIKGKAYWNLGSMEKD